MSHEQTAGWAHIDRLVGVYEADGGIAGELAYVAGKLLGWRHCALCDITHSALRRKAEWDDFVTSLPVPFEVVHLNERASDIRKATQGQTPCVVACSGASAPRLLLGADDLEELSGSVDRFADALRSAVLDLTHDPGAVGPTTSGEASA